MTENSTTNSELSTSEIVETLVTPANTHISKLQENGAELRAMGFRDISDADESKIMDEALNNVQIQRVLSDSMRRTTDNKSPRDYLEDYLTFLHGISPGKTKAEIALKITIEHAASILKTTAKMELPPPLLKKHLKNFKKHYS